MNVKPLIVSEQKLSAVSHKVAGQYLAEGSAKMWAHHTDKAAVHSRSARQMLFILLGVDRMDPELADC